jgi:hypothetical protein
MDFWIRGLINFVDKNDNCFNANLSTKEDMLSRLSHATILIQNDSNSGIPVALTTRIAASIFAAPVIIFLT